MCGWWVEFILHIGALPILFFSFLFKLVHADEMAKYSRDKWLEAVLYMLSDLTGHPFMACPRDYTFRVKSNNPLRVCSHTATCTLPPPLHTRSWVGFGHMQINVGLAWWVFSQLSPIAPLFKTLFFANTINWPNECVRSYHPHPVCFYLVVLGFVFQ